MRNLKNLNIEESLKSKKLIYTVSWFDRLDQIVNYLVFSWGFVLPFFIYFNAYRNQAKTGIEFYFAFLFSLFCGYAVYRKATEKRLIEIKSQFDAEENRKLVNKYCEERGFEKYRNSKNIIIYNSESTFNINSNYKSSRIFLLDNQSVYITMIKESYKINIPVLFSQFFLKKDLQKILMK